MIQEKKLPLSKRIARSYQLYLMLLVPVSMVMIFCYLPMYGAQIAFKKYNIVDGIVGSPWVGLQWFQKFVANKMFGNTLINTLILNGNLACAPRWLSAWIALDTVAGWYKF